MNEVLHWLSSLPSFRSRALGARLLVLVATLTATVIAEAADYQGVVTRHITSQSEQTTIQTVSVLMPAAQLPQRITLMQSVAAHGLNARDFKTRVFVNSDFVNSDFVNSNDMFFSKLSIERFADQLIVTGWHAVQLKPDYRRRSAHGQSQGFFLQEIRITLPIIATAGGWDVKSLERELQRLGIKVKPKPSIPRPTQQLRS